MCIVTFPDTQTLNLGSTLGIYILATKQIAVQNEILMFFSTKIYTSHIMLVMTKCVKGLIGLFSTSHYA